MQPGAFGPGHGTPGGGGGGHTGKSSGTITPQHTPGPSTHPGTGNKKPNPSGAGFNTLPQLLPNGIPITQYHGVPTWNSNTGVLWNPGDWLAKLTNGTFLDLSHKYPGIQVTYGSGGRVWYKRPGMANQQLLTGG